MMKKMKPETAKWIFGSLAIILTVWITKEPEYLWALWLLVLSDD